MQKKFFIIQLLSFFLTINSMELPTFNGQKSIEVGVTPGLINFAKELWRSQKGSAKDLEILKELFLKLSRSEQQFLEDKEKLETLVLGLQKKEPKRSRPTNEKRYDFAANLPNHIWKQIIEDVVASDDNLPKKLRNISALMRTCKKVFDCTNTFSNEALREDFIKILEKIKLNPSKSEGFDYDAKSIKDILTSKGNIVSLFRQAYGKISITKKDQEILSMLLGRSQLGSATFVAAKAILANDGKQESEGPADVEINYKTPGLLNFAKELMRYKKSPQATQDLKYLEQLYLHLDKTEQVVALLLATKKSVFFEKEEVKQRLYLHAKSVREESHSKQFPIDSFSGFDGLEMDSGLSHWLTANPLPASTQMQTWNGYEIRDRYCYNTPGATELLIVIIIHGTTVADFKEEAGPYNPDYFEPSFFDPENPDRQIFRNFMNFAAYLGNTKNKKVELLSYRWPGKNYGYMRKHAALFLNDYITTNYPNNEKAILAHSHGCNVANLLTNLVTQPIELLVYFACPVRENINKENKENLTNKYLFNSLSPQVYLYKKLSKLTNYSPDKFKQLIYFYSTNDWVAVGGALHGQAVASSVAVPGTIGGTGGVVAYTKGIAALGGLPGCLAVVAVTALSGANSFSCIKDDMAHAYILQDQQRKRMTPIRLQLNAEGPAHGDVPKVSSILPEIFQSLNSDYINHFVTNSKFDLNIDGNTLTNHKNSMCLTIREQGDMRHLRSAPEYIRAKADDEAFDQEIRTSNARMDRFLARYQKAINEHKKDHYEKCAIS